MATEEGAGDILNHLTLIESRLRGMLVALFEPSPHPAPTCLTHMDSWTDNLLFRIKGNAASIRPVTDPQVELQSLKKSRTKAARIEDSPLECKIIDWQMVAVGRPTHDLALLLITSLTPEDRETYTPLLLAYYYQTFAV